jgi:ribosomal protein L11 methyltransferase
MRFGRRLWVCPGGQRPQLDDAAAAACLIELDPGLAFGTGTHPTTALCLEWLDGASLAGKSVVDYGCGSGVLAIAALKLGASAALAIDIDPQALIATRDNAARNHVADRLTVTGAGAASTRAADILLANILAEPLLELAPSFAERVAPGGCVVLSGILRSQAGPVASRYAAWFDMSPATLRDDWALLYGVRRS